MKQETEENVEKENMPPHRGDGLVDGMMDNNIKAAPAESVI